MLAAAIAVLRWPFAWTGNEENYFLLGHRLVDPGSYGPFTAAFDSSRGKWLGLLSFGSVVQAIGFEAAHALLGGVTIAVTAAGLAALARMLALGTWASLALLLLFMALGQTLAGGEWFVGAIETKTLSYGFGLLALAAANSGRVLVSAVLVALSAYFHFLVGGFWLFITSIFVAFNPAARNDLRAFVCVSVMLLLPLLCALLLDARDAAALAKPAGLPDADTIYSIIRAPHHVAPFDGSHPWFRRAIAMAFLAVVAGPAAWLASRRLDQGALRALLRTIAIGMAILPVAVIGSWLDRHHGVLGKFYLFRPASPLLLLSLFASAAFVEQRLADRSWNWVLWAGLAAFSFYHMRVTPQYFWPAQDNDVRGVVAAVRAHTAPDQIVLVDPTLDEFTASSLPRKLGRPTFVTWKFVPTNPADIYEWYRRIELRRRLFNSGCPTNPRVAALVIATRNAHLKSRCGRQVFTNPEMTVLALTH